MSEQERFGSTLLAALRPLLDGVPPTAAEQAELDLMRERLRAEALRREMAWQGELRHALGGNMAQRLEV